MLFYVARLIELLRADDTGRGTYVLTSKFKFKTQVLNWARTDVAPRGKGYFQAVSYILLIYGPDANWKSFESAELAEIIFLALVVSPMNFTGIQTMSL